jgi:Homeodomain-like domain
MATALPISKPSRESRELKLKFPRPLIESLAEMAKLSGAPVNSYVVELLETQIADWRLRRIPADFQYGDADKTPVPETADDSKPYGRLSDEDKIRIIKQHADGMSVPQIAARWHVGDSSVRRVLHPAKKRMLPPETVQKIIFLKSKRHDYDNAHAGNPVVDIAKAVGASESVVQEVLANYKPLTPRSGAIYASAEARWMAAARRSRLGEKEETETMGARRTIIMSKTAERPLTEAMKSRIVKLHDKPYTPLEISRETGVAVDLVRQTLRELCPLDELYA